jgi:DNA-binding response OmpR family regulator
MSNESPAIIVVEDDDSMRLAIERILRAGGFVAVAFDSAEAAIEAGNIATADALVFDIRLSGMSGFDLYRRVIEFGERPPVIFITAHDEPDVRKEAEDLGASAYLPKPFSGRALLDELNNALCPH